jgi:hypothetical protein
MSNFTEILLVSPMPDGKNWAIMKNFGYAVGSEDSGEVIDVPFGFLTDFASVPRIFWWMFPKWGKYGNAAVIHDFLYWDQRYTRKKSDSVFLEAMGVLGVNKMTARILYLAVYLFGFVAWKSNQSRKKKLGSRVLKKFRGKVTEWRGMKKAISPGSIK